MTRFVEPPPRLLRLPEVMAMTGIGRSQLARLEEEGSFPARRAIGTRAIAWMESEVLAWIERRPRKAVSGPKKGAQP